MLLCWYCEGVINLVIAVLVLLAFLYFLKQYRKGLKEYCEWTFCRMNEFWSPKAYYTKLVYIF